LADRPSFPSTLPKVTATPVPQSADLDRRSRPRPTSASNTIRQAPFQHLSPAAHHAAQEPEIRSIRSITNQFHPSSWSRFRGGRADRINMNTAVEDHGGACRQSAQATQALNFVGPPTVAVNGNGRPDGQRPGRNGTTRPPVPEPREPFTITQFDRPDRLSSQTGTVQPGAQQFVWNGIGNTGPAMARRQLHFDGHHQPTRPPGKRPPWPTQVTGRWSTSVDLNPESPPAVGRRAETSP